MIHRRLQELAGAVSGAIAGLAALGLLLSGLHIVFALAIAAVVAAIVSGGPGVVGSVALLAAVAAARALVIWVRDTTAARLGASVRVRLRARLLTRAVGISATDRDSGRIAAIAIDGVDGLEAYFTRYLPQLLVVLVIPATVVALTIGRAPTAGVALGIAAAVAVLAPRAWDARLLRTGRERWEQFARLSSDFVESLEHIPLLRIFGATARTADRLSAEGDALRRDTMGQLRLSLVETAVSALAMHFGATAAVISATLAVSTGDGDGAAAVAVLLLARECFRPVQDLGACWHAGYLGLSAVDGLDELQRSSSMAPRMGRRPRPAPTGLLEFEDVSFTYPATGRGVRDVRLRVEAAETLAVIGPSGAGKSTLARLVERDIVPEAGIIRIGGVDIRDFDRVALSASVAVVPQDPVLFAWSVRDNLRLCRPSAADAEVEQAARVADVHDVIAGLPEGYDTVLSENGGQLSGGQRQRLAIARAVLSPAPVLILDEATSALDAESERRIVDAVATVAAGWRTVVFITHRESTGARADHWVAIEDGRVAARGRGAVPASRGAVLR